MKANEVFTKMLILIIISSISNTYSQQLWNDVGHIPQNCQIDWTHAGLWSSPPSVADTVFQINLMSGQSWGEKLHNAIYLARDYVGSAVIYFPKGSYAIDSRIVFLNSSDYNNIIFQGAGANKTVLQFTTNNEDNNLFEIKGSTTGSEIVLDYDITKGDSIIASASGHFNTLSAGDWINFWEEEYPVEDDARVGQITQVEWVSSNRDSIRIKDTANKTYLVSRDLRLIKFTPIMNIGIENLKIKRMDEEPSAQGEYHSGNNFRFEWAVNCWIKGVESEQTCRHHIVISKSSHIEVSGSYIHHARSYGENSYGYGTVLGESSTNCLIENNIFQKLRHAMGIGTGANCNVYTYNFSTEQYSTKLGIPYEDSDICLHGRYPYANLYEQNKVEYIEADKEHGINGHYNAFVRNHVYDKGIDLISTFDYAVLGNIDAIEDACLVVDENCDPSVDIYGFLNGYTQGFPHILFHQGYYSESLSALQDISYYYSARPDFLPDSYTWPSLGPKVDGTSLTQNIPTSTRYYTDTKTYNNDPVEKEVHYAGSLPYDQTWSNTHTLTGDVTIPSGITLTVLPGTYVNVPAGKKITVNGTLIAQGTASQPITFNKSSSSSWYGIKFEDSSNDLESILQYCIVKNASYAVYCNNASPTIKNCEIGYSMVGIYCYGSSQSQTIQSNEIKYNSLYGLLLSHAYAPLVLDNDIHNYGTNVRCYYSGYSTTLRNNHLHESGATGDGIQFQNATPIVIENLIYDNGRYGAYCLSNSAPEFLHEDIGSSNNVIAYNSSYGLRVDNSSLPLLGGLADGKPAHNSLYSNGGKEVYNENASQIEAGYNWWGQAPPSGSRIYGSVNTANYLSGDPNPDPHGLGKGLAEAGETTLSGEVITAINEEARKAFDKGYKSELKNDYAKAIEEYQAVINGWPDEPEATMALVHMTYCYDKIGNKVMSKIKVKAIAGSWSDKEVGAKAKELDAIEDVKAGRIDQALVTYEELASDFSGKEPAQNALFEKWQIYFNLKGDEKAARAEMAKYESRYGRDDNLLMMQTAMGDLTVEMFEPMPKRSPGNENEEPAESLGETQRPKEYALVGNYPNPFNPETQIAYELPTESRVTFEIYNVLGQKITTLLDAKKPAGRHLVKWDATSGAAKVSGGIYLVRMRAGSYTKTIKVMLLP